MEEAICTLSMSMCAKIIIHTLICAEIIIYTMNVWIIISAHINVWIIIFAHIDTDNVQIASSYKALIFNLIN